MPRFTGADALLQMQRWFQQINPRTLKLTSEPIGELTFFVTGEVLEDYAGHLQRVRQGLERQDFELFRPGHRYHQLGRLTTQDGHSLPHAILLDYAHESSTAGSGTVPLAMHIFDTNLEVRPQLGDRDRLGAWSASDSRGSRLVMGPLTYSGTEDWSDVARATVADFIKQFGLGFLNR
jgi:hypothetical protein